MSESPRQHLRAHAALEGLAHYAYRACAPAESDPRLAARDEVTPLAVFHGPECEEQQARAAREAAAKALCSGCPIVAACRAYALGPEDADGPREREGVWGGLTPAERRRLRSPRQSAAAMALAAVEAPPVRTEQRDRVLAALAAHRDEEAVAEAAGVDVRTANWQRRRLVTMLGLDPDTATRMQLLTTAWHRGLLPQDVELVPDGLVTVPAVPSSELHVLLAQARKAGHVPARQRRRRTPAGQLALDLDAAAGVTPVRAVQLAVA